MNGLVALWFYEQPISKSYCHNQFIGVGGVGAACSACNQMVVGSNPGSALLITEVNVVDIQLRALLGLCSFLVHSTECAGNYVMVK